MSSREVVKKWVYGALTKPITILKGIYLNINDKNRDLSEMRMSICEKCDSMLDTKFGKVCEECGCVLANKTRLENEECLLGKW